MAASRMVYTPSSEEGVEGMAGVLPFWHPRDLPQCHQRLSSHGQVRCLALTAEPAHCRYLKANRPPRSAQVRHPALEEALVSTGRQPSRKRRYQRASTPHLSLADLSNRVTCGQ